MLPKLNLYAAADTSHTSRTAAPATSSRSTGMPQRCCRKHSRTPPTLAGVPEARGGVTQGGASWPAVVMRRRRRGETSHRRRRRGHQKQRTARRCRTGNGRLIACAPACVCSRCRRCLNGTSSPRYSAIHTAALSRRRRAQSSSPTRSFRMTFGCQDLWLTLLQLARTPLERTRAARPELSVKLLRLHMAASALLLYRRTGARRSST
jgi:hypothetical protein